MIGVKYQYTSISRYISYFNESYNYNYEYNHRFADYNHKINQLVLPIIINWNMARSDYFSYYLGVGYEHGFVISQREAYEAKGDGFNINEYYISDEYNEHINLSVPSRAIVLQMGFAGRHWDWKAYYKLNANSSKFHNAEKGVIGTAFTYYF